jgi:hypothetical protein
MSKENGHTEHASRQMHKSLQQVQSVFFLAAGI